MWQRRIRWVVAVVAVFLVACVHADRPVRKTLPEEDWHEYVVYRIDDHRYISIRSPQICNGHLDGNIYYNDTQSGVRKFVSFTGPMRNGLYQGYYAVRTDPMHIAIPAISFSQIRGMMLRIYYSHDGGRSFQGFSVGPYSGEDNVVLLNGNDLYIARRNPMRPEDYSRSPGVVYDIDKDMDRRVAFSAAPPTAFDKYGKGVYRYQVPFDLKSPSGETRWTCPIAIDK
ncbi:hypothetical protein [Burkholderia sp. Ac-20344]|uniref:T6SS immunity protein Tli3 family protein n=1 Tax=Burkholderia sp. Ac-20344 TaxID=2703890 RepID=UPI00197C7E29|nr:hypothetical protein [Burkholderia sp. Ac-20344]MBN3830776.1 hypothetical protein [Burkholderia sp. Ac-20344]